MDRDLWCREREEEEEERTAEAGAVEARDPEVVKLLEGREAPGGRGEKAQEGERGGGAGVREQAHQACRRGQGPRDTGTQGRETRY